MFGIFANVQRTKLFPKVAIFKIFPFACLFLDDAPGQLVGWVHYPKRELPLLDLILFTMCILCRMAWQ